MGTNRYPNRLSHSNHPALGAHCFLGYVRLRICTVTYLFYLLQWGIFNSSSVKYELRELEMWAYSEKVGRNI